MVEAASMNDVDALVVAILDSLISFANLEAVCPGHLIDRKGIPV